MKTFRMLALVMTGSALVCAGCKKDPEPKPIPVPTQAAAPAAPAPGAMPEGHPPMGGAEAAAQPAMPPGHPPINTAAPLPVPGTATAGEGIAFEAPAEWQVKPARSMLWKVFNLPKADGDAEDGEVTISSLAANIPLNANVERWCGQFDLEGGKPCSEAAKIKDLPGTAFPTKVVEIAGAMKSASMAGGAAAPKAGWRLTVLEVTMPGKAWYLKMTGPAKTVAKWQDAFLKAAAAIK